MTKAKKEEISVALALAWSNKHKKLKGEGVRVVHIKQLLLSHRHQIIQEAKERLGKMNKSPCVAQFAENMDGPSLCSTCNEEWEYCVCSAINRGYKKGIDDALSELDKMEKV